MLQRNGRWKESLCHHFPTSLTGFTEQSIFKLVALNQKKRSLTGMCYMLFGISRNKGKGDVRTKLPRFEAYNFYKKK